MKFLLFSLSILLLSASFGQKTFKNDQKKWGISRDGTGGKEDSIIFRAEFDEIKVLEGAYGSVFCGARNDEWQLLTSNKLVNQQRYSVIRLPEFTTEMVVAYREGYIDLVRVDSGSAEFYIRGVKAEGLFNGDDLTANLGEEFVMTTAGKGVYGLVNTATGKEVLKAQYSSIEANFSYQETGVAIIAVKDGKQLAIDIEGNVIFEIPAEVKVFNIEAVGNETKSHLLVAEGKKENSQGMYDERTKWFIPPVYEDIELVDNLADVVFVTGSKGRGIYFEGKEILPAEYITVEKSDKRGFVAKVSDKKGYYYVTPEGKLHNAE